jgi:hypothetical protein
VTEAKRTTPEEWVSSGGIDRYKRMKRARDHARTRVTQLEAEVHELRMENLRLLRTLEDAIHGSPL